MSLKVVFELCYENNFHNLFVREVQEYDTDMAIQKATEHILKFNNLKSYRVVKVTNEPVIFQKFDVGITYQKPQEQFTRKTFINTYAENPRQAEKIVNNIVADWPDGKNIKYRITTITVKS